MKISQKNLKFSYKKAPLIVAEISGNHNGNKRRFLKLVHSACKNGADLIKIQSYEVKDITLEKKSKRLKIKKGIWKGKYLNDLYKKACTPFDWHSDAFKIAKKYKKIIFSSPFSVRAVDFLEKLKVPIYKIASFEITDYHLIEYIASKKKPIIISTGMASLNEIKNAIKIIEKYHRKIIILHCVSNYPTNLRDSNLKNITFLKKKFKRYSVGLSDHTNDIYSSIAAIPLGVSLIEKHFNIDDKKTEDSSFSIKPEMLKKLKESSVDIFKSININSKIKLSKKNIKFRRSLFAKKRIKKNEKFSKENIISLRPKIGVCSSNYFKILGKISKKNINKDSPIFSNDY